MKKKFRLKYPFRLYSAHNSLDSIKEYRYNIEKGGVKDATEFSNYRKNVSASA